MTLFITVWRKSFSPATLGEKRDDMFSGLCRMASSNASLEGTGRARPQETRGYRDPWVTETREQTASSPSVGESRHESTHDKGQDRWQGRQGRASIRKMLSHAREVKQTQSTPSPGNKGAPELCSMPTRQFTKGNWSESDTTEQHLIQRDVCDHFFYFSNSWPYRIGQAVGALKGKAKLRWKKKKKIPGTQLPGKLEYIPCSITLCTQHSLK